MTPTKPRKPAVDWDAIEPHYRAGIPSASDLREKLASRLAAEVAPRPLGLIERLAREAGFSVREADKDVDLFISAPMDDYDDCAPCLQRFAALIAEECAKLCEAPSNDQLEACKSVEWDSMSCATAIREKFKVTP